MTSAERFLQLGQPSEALAALQQEVRANPANVRLRIFLFQLLAVMGQWPRALQQLKVCGELDASTAPMVGTYTPALQCEALRTEVFAGRSTPHVFGPPAGWVALLVQALQLDAAGHTAEAALARSAALDQAPASSGRLNEEPFSWIADADGRLGPVLEVIINGRYGWLPFEHLHMLTLEPVVDLRDLVWAPAQLTLSNGAETVALLPVRYEGSTQSDSGSTPPHAQPAANPAWLMARATDWRPLGAPPVMSATGGTEVGPSRGMGQRLLATDAGDTPLLALRRLVIDPPVVAAAADC